MINEYEEYIADKPVDKVAPKLKKDKYKDPVNDKILKEISKKIREFRKYNTSSDISDVDSLHCYRIGLYAGMNITLRNLGREPL